MSENSFPGFEDDEPAKPAAPAPATNAPSAPAPKPAVSKPAVSKPAATKPATGRINAGDAPPPLAGASGPVDFEFEPSEPAAPKKPNVVPPKPSAEGPVAKIDRSPPPPPAGAEDVDPDLKPGSRKDLWNCPHCGTGNRPGRDTCRACGKSPDEAVITHWTRKPVVWIGAGAGVVLLLVILIMSAGHTDLSFKDADSDSIDQSARVGGSPSAGKHVIAGQDFTATHQLSVCGRVIGATQMSTLAGGWTVALLLGKQARDPEAAKAAKVDFNGDITEVSGDSGRKVVLHLMPGGLINTSFKPKAGSIISLTGDSGELDGLTNGAGEYSVFVTQLQ